MLNLPSSSSTTTSSISSNGMIWEESVLSGHYLHDEAVV